MSFFTSLNGIQHSRGRFIFWLRLTAVSALFFALVISLVRDALAQQTQPVIANVASLLPSLPLDRSKSAILPEFQAWISNTENDVHPTASVSFFPNEKIYLHILFPQLSAGIARVNVNWISPAGKMNNSAEQIVRQVAPGPATVRFWLSFSRNGAVTEMFTGKEFKPQVYGQWQARVYFNGAPLTMLLFLVHE